MSVVNSIYWKTVNIKRVKVVGDGSEQFIAAVRDLKDAPIQIIDNIRDGIDAVISAGGDGSLLGANREYSGRYPIIPVRQEHQYKKCNRHALPNILDALAFREVPIYMLDNLCFRVKGDGPSGFALNDIIIHNADQRSAIRYEVYINDKIYCQEVVGDGVVVSSPFGSTAYYRSITKSIFRTGVGVAFNNSIEAVDHLVLSDADIVEIKIKRGPAILSYDNGESAYLKTGDVIGLHMTIRASKFYMLDSLFCKECIHIESGKPAGWRHI